MPSSLRAGLTLAMLAFASRSHGISLPAPQIAELCANAEDQAHCGRLIEEVQLKRLPGLAVRDGDDLKVSLFPSGMTMFRDSVAISGAKSFTLWDYLDWINAVVLFTTDGDQTGFVLLQRTNGKQYRLPAEPVLSPDRQHLVTVDICAKICDGEVAVRHSLRSPLFFQPRARSNAVAHGLHLAVRQRQHAQDLGPAEVADRDHGVKR